MDGQVERRPGRLVIVCGLPGSGKTTYTLEIASRTKGVRLSADEWMEALGFNLWDEDFRARVEELQWAHAQDLLSAGMTVLIEWGTWGRSERDRLRSEAREVGARVELHYLEAPVDVLFERIQRRGTEDPPITREQLLEWEARFEVPGPDELALFDAGRVILQG